MKNIFTLSLSLMLVGCGGGNSGNTTPTNPAPTPTPPSQPTTPIIKNTAFFNLIDGVATIQTKLFTFGLKIFNPVTDTDSAVFNFNNDQFNGKIIRQNTDDAAPVKMMGTYIGGRHGYSRTILNIPNHGKTYADVGSVWTDGYKEWVIIQIISPSEIAITSRKDNSKFNLGMVQLRHVGGANNTIPIKPVSLVDAQWYPMLKNHDVKLEVDGHQIQEKTMKQHFEKSLKVTESYDLMEKNEIVEWVIANKGSQLLSYAAPSAINVFNQYTFYPDGTNTIYTKFSTYKDLSAAKAIMVTQSYPLSFGVDGPIQYYIPRSIPFSLDSINYDFSKPYTIDNLKLPLKSSIIFDTNNTEPNSVLPDRMIMLSNKIGYATGYLPVLDASPSVRNTKTTKGLELSNTKLKVYPYLVDGLSTLPGGASYSAVAYRKYFVRPSEPKRTVQYDIPSDYGDYLYLDWHGGDFIDTIELPDYMHNRPFEVIEKTDNVELTSNISTNRIVVKIGNVTSNARLIIKF